MDAAVGRSLEFDEEARFNEALLSAFDDTFKLRRLLRYRLGRNLDDFVSDRSDREEVVFELIQEANAGGWWEQLVVATRDSQPQNPLLLAFAQEVGLAVAPPKEPTAEQPAVPGPAPARPSWPGSLDLDTWRSRLGEIEGRVCRVEVGRAGGDPGTRGTGFLVGPDVVMTAHDVVADVVSGKSRPEDLVLRFDYKRSLDGVTINQGTEYRLAATDWLILASPNSALEDSLTPTEEAPDPDQLNFVLMRLDRAAGLEPLGRWGEPNAPPRGWITAPGIEPAPQSDSSMYMVQHPRGDPLVVEIGTVRGAHPVAGARYLRYQVRSAGGSSGAPCFDDRWQLVAMHHRHLRPLGEDEREGVLIGPILRHVARQFFLGRLAENAGAATRSDPTTAEPKERPELNAKHREDLHFALLNAFPTTSDLHKIVREGLTLNLESISGPAESLPSSVFNLVRWAEAQGKIGDLVAAARQQNPDNPALAAIADQLSEEPVPPG